MTISVYANAVARGAALLDQEKPGWASMIDVDNLLMHDGKLCVLGQTYVDYDQGMSELFGEDWGIEKAIHHGFDFVTSYAYAEGALDVKRAWIREIESRIPFEGYRWIVYLEQSVGSFEVTRVKSLAEAKEALSAFSKATYTYQSASARLYPYTTADYWEAVEYEEIGCPFDYPSKLIEFGPRGGINVTNA